jgi:hypothetical protein
VKERFLHHTRNGFHSIQGCTPEGDFEMKMRKWSQVPLLIGLALGCLAIWSGAAF